MATFLRSRTREATSLQVASAMKAKQSAKIGELRDALVAEGLSTLDEQAAALGVCRSTAWTILKAKHKASGLSATTINSILATSKLHPLMRSKILEYIQEKAIGLYGHSKTQRSVSWHSLLSDGAEEPKMQPMETRAKHVIIQRSASLWSVAKSALRSTKAHSNTRLIINDARSSVRTQLP